MNLRLAGIAPALFLSATLQASSVLVPVVSFLSRGVPQPGSTQPYSDFWWISAATVSNPTEQARTYRVVQVLGNPAAVINFTCVGLSFSVAPNSFREVLSPAGGCATVDQGSALLEIDLDPDLVVTASMHLQVFRTCVFAGTEASTVGYAPMPVFRRPFLPTSPATSTEVLLGDNHQPTVCPADSDPKTWRTNVALFNLGQGTATFTVSAPGSKEQPYVVQVSSNDGLQLNGVFPGEGYRSLVVTSTEPFVCWASTVSTYLPVAHRPQSFNVYAFQSQE